MAKSLPTCLWIPRLACWACPGVKSLENSSVALLAKSMVRNDRSVLLGLMCNCWITEALTADRMATRAVPGNAVGVLKFNDVPTGTPGIPGIGLGIELPPSDR